MTILDKTIKAAHLTASAIRSSYNLHSTTTEKLQQYTDFERRACKDMTSENGLYNAISNSHNG
jgi:hypothetical protein